MNKAIENRAKIDQIKADLHKGLITYEEAQALAEPIINGINGEMAVIAKKHKRKATKLNFSGLMR